MSTDQSDADAKADWWQQFTDEGSVAFTKTKSMTRKERYARTYEESVLVPVRIIWADWRARIGLLTIVSFVFMGLVGPHLLDPPTTTGPRLVEPFQTLAHPLGTDGLGQDILGLIVYSTPPMLLMITSGAICATAVAFVTGVIAGYKGGRVDQALLSLIDMVIAVPGFPLIIVIAAIFKPENPLLIGVVLSVNAWAGLARMIRAETLSIRQHDYVEASSTMGLSTMRIVWKDIFPNLAPYVSMHFVGMARRVIFHSVGLYFLGVLPFTVYNWGIMMNNAYKMGALNSWDIAHWLFFPMVVIIVLTTGLTLFTQAFDNVFNPRIRVRHVDDAEQAPEANGGI